jgi:phosphatidylserine/phosphatidylglycerophosphate/cardiolipin synthase-like enzyme
VRCALDSKERPLHCHHEKTVVVDDRVAFVGGIDLTLQSGDRFDSSDHPARVQLGWRRAEPIGGAGRDVLHEDIGAREQAIQNLRADHISVAILPTVDGTGESGQAAFARRWWTLAVLCLSLVLVVVAATLLGDAVRDRLDPDKRRS